MAETIVAFLGGVMRAARGWCWAAYSLLELLVAGGVDGAGDAGAESPLDVGAVFVSDVTFFSAGADSLEELLLFEE